MPAPPAPQQENPDPQGIAAALAMALPAECAAGVRQNAATLMQHWAAVRAALDETGAA